MRLGIYGGSFNPPHVGHVLAAEQSVLRLGLDRLLVIPACQAPHKQQQAGTPTAAQRLRLTELAFADIPQAEVSDIEIKRQGVSYTVDTLRALKQQYPDDELILLMGTDMLLSFLTWRAPEEIAKLADLAVMHRSSESEAQRREVDAAAKEIEDLFGCRVLRAENESVEISSTEIRRMITFGLPEYRLPGPVAELIRREGLYGCGADLKNLPFETLKERSLSLHDEKRRPHVLGCCETAWKLAERWGADPEAARRAGILHDVTKALSPAAQLAICERYAQPLTDFERAHPKLVHAKSGAAVAGEIFGESAEVCDAIRWHTTGKEKMTLLEKIVYLADYMEPNRAFDGVERLRALCDSDLDAALEEGLRMSLENLRRCGRPIDPCSMQAWQYLSSTKEKEQ